MEAEVFSTVLHVLTEGCSELSDTSSKTAALLASFSQMKQIDMLAMFLSRKEKTGTLLCQVHLCVALTRNIALENLLAAIRPSERESKVIRQTFQL